MKGIGTQELLIILVLLLVLFGGRKLPELGKGIGESVKELRKASKPEEKSKTKKK